jgi:hypothetical protein
LRETGKKWGCDKGRNDEKEKKEWEKEVKG